MDSFLFGVTIFLMILAAFDLFVGVSNDAVNFLSSALGCKAASYNRIMLVAGAGVLLGCTFSSGMMEIARSGIFNPNMFTYQDVMTIFFSVMITDVIVLNIFNTLGLPTSTTVSVVFELLGGAVVAAGYKLSAATGSLGGISAYISNDRALVIIIGILMSVIIAFTFGAIIQWIIRLIFSFNLGKVYRALGGIYGGFCITAILYFLVIKGARGASFMTPALLAWLDVNTLPIMLTTFFVCSFFFSFFIWTSNFNVLRLIILAGTFSLAFAFAGNDLVNFVGVPLAALQSTEIADTAYAANAALTPAAMTMEGLKESVQTPTAYLVAFGLIMVFTLWFSPKARRVVQTAINLSASERSDKEQFGSSSSSRLVVRSALTLNRAFEQIMPKSVLFAIDMRMAKPALKKGEVALPFDQLRASVNLVLASILIALATSWKLPLSTTYVTFMVAMGSSLADGAWDRESAVYRISGVFAVISGWFITALTAFTACGIIVLTCMWLGKYYMIALAIVVVAIVVKTNLPTKKKVKVYDRLELGENLTKEELRVTLNKLISKLLRNTVVIFSSTTKALLKEDLKKLQKNRRKANDLLDRITKLRGKYYLMIIHEEDGDADYDARNYYYRTFSNMKDVAHMLRNVVNQAEQHVANSHSVFKGVLRDNLLKSVSDLIKLHRTLDSCIMSGFASEDVLLLLSNTNLEEFNLFQLELMKEIDLYNMPLHRSELYLALLQFCREVVNRYTVVVLLQRELNKMLSPDTVEAVREPLEEASDGKPPSHGDHAEESVSVQSEVKVLADEEDALDEKDAKEKKAKAEAKAAKKAEAEKEKDKDKEKEKTKSKSKSK